MIGIFRQPALSLLRTHSIASGSFRLILPTNFFGSNSIATMADALKGKNLEKKQGSNFSKVDPAAHLKNKVVGLYFSAHWCPPCRAFTPILKDFYEQVEDQGFEIVFVTFDRTEPEFKQYLAESHGNWSFIPYGDPAIQELAKKYGVEGVPTLVIVKPNGDVISKNARSDVQNGQKGPVELFGEWKQSAGL